MSQRGRGRAPRCALFTMASADQDLLAALQLLAKATDSATAETMRQTRRATTVPIGELTVATIGQTLCALMPDNAVLVDEAATNGPKIFAATEGARSHDYLSPVNGERHRRRVPDGARSSNRLPRSQGHSCSGRRERHVHFTRLVGAGARARRHCRPLIKERRVTGAPAGRGPARAKTAGAAYSSFPSS